MIPAARPVQRRSGLALVPVLLLSASLALTAGLALSADTALAQAAPKGTCSAKADAPCTECCTSLLAGKAATVDGSVMTSHSCDSNTDRTWMNMVPHRTYGAGAMDTVWMEPKETKGPDDPDRLWSGIIPEVAETYKFLNAAYPIMNEHQLSIGETTTGGKRELRSTEGMIDAPELYRLVLQRAKTAREAIRVADELTKKHGYNDWGECFTFADPQEAWFFEI
ncbi:MAG: dipeptidase, partial [Gemmatimonadetes bacterium]|nr:dipeptidase [Gemmatimonadota bacterium]